jgi:hypothetical protein
MHFKIRLPRIKNMPLRINFWSNLEDSTGMSDIFLLISLNVGVDLSWLIDMT